MLSYFKTTLVTFLDGCLILWTTPIHLFGSEYFMLKCKADREALSRLTVGRPMIMLHREWTSPTRTWPWLFSCSSRWNVILSIIGPFTCTSSLESPTKEPQNVRMSFASNQSFSNVTQNRTSVELSSSININFIFQSSYYTIMTMRSLLWAWMSMVSLLEKTYSDFDSFSKFDSW